MANHVQPDLKGPIPFIGMKVQIDGTDIIGEVTVISDKIKNLIKEIKHIKADGKVELIEVANVVLHAVEIAHYVVKNSLIKRIGLFFKNMFSR